MKTRRGTCNGCGKVRKLTYPEKSDIRYYGLCSECFPKVSSQEDIKTLRREREPKKRRPRFAYPVIGGPLDGEYATTEDFYSGWGDIPDGMYKHLNNEYSEYNASRGSRKRIGAAPSMIFIHKSLLKPLISPKER